jgi:hypothetical protein
MNLEIIVKTSLTELKSVLNEQVMSSIERICTDIRRSSCDIPPETEAALSPLTIPLSSLFHQHL